MIVLRMVSVILSLCVCACLWVFLHCVVVCVVCVCAKICWSVASWSVLVVIVCVDLCCLRMCVLCRLHLWICRSTWSGVRKWNCVVFVSGICIRMSAFFTLFASCVRYVTSYFGIFGFNVVGHFGFNVVDCDSFVYFFLAHLHSIDNWESSSACLSMSAYFSIMCACFSVLAANFRGSVRACCEKKTAGINAQEIGWNEMDMGHGWPREGCQLDSHSTLHAGCNGKEHPPNTHSTLSVLRY